MSHRINLSFEEIQHRTRAGEAYAIRWYLISRGQSATRVTLSELYGHSHEQLLQVERENSIMLSGLSEREAG